MSGTVLGTGMQEQTEETEVPAFMELIFLWNTLPILQMGRLSFAEGG